MSVVSAKNITKTFGEAPNKTIVLKNISLQINKGEFLSIIGPSGSGKSTLMYLLGLLDVPTTGTIYINGQKTKDISEKDRAKLRNREIGFVFQTYNLLPRTSALANVMLPLNYSNVSRDERKSKAMKLLKDVGLSHRISSFPSQLSGGEQQRVAIARSLICGPSIILADEPTGNLDTKTGEQIINIISQLNKQGKTIVLVTHDNNIAKKTNRIVTIKDGQVLSDKKNR